MGWLRWSFASSGFLLLGLGISGHLDLLGSAQEEGRKEMRGKGLGVPSPPILLLGHYTQARATGFLLPAPDHPRSQGPLPAPGSQGLQEAAMKTDLK